jgi:hypothetical protein
MLTSCEQFPHTQVRVGVRKRVRIRLKVRVGVR